MAFTYYECEEQVDKILTKIDEEINQKYFTSNLMAFYFQAVEVEFSEEEATSYVHRDKNKEINVLEWIALVIQEPLQVEHFSNFFINITIFINIHYFIFLGCRPD